MDIMELGALGELVGGVAVVVTLIYLVVQVRQNTHQLEQATEVARGSAEIETAKMNMSYNAEFVRDPQLMLIWEKAYNEPDTLSPEELSRWSISTAFWFHLAQGNYRQYQRGLLPSESWEPVERGIVGVVRTELGQKWWTQHEGIGALATDFRAHVDAIAASYEGVAWKPVRASSFEAS